MEFAERVRRNLPPMLAWIRVRLSDVGLERMNNEGKHVPLSSTKFPNLCIPFEAEASPKMGDGGPAGPRGRTILG